MLSDLLPDCRKALLNDLLDIGQIMPVAASRPAQRVEYPVRRIQNFKEPGAEIMCCPFAGSPAFPIWKDIVQKIRFIFIRNLQSIHLAYRHEIQFLFVKKAEFREDGSTAGSGSMISRNQFLVIDKNSHMLQQILKRLGAADNIGFPLCLPIAFRHQAGPFHTDFRNNGPHTRIQKFRSFPPVKSGRKKMFIHDASPSDNLPFAFLVLL